MTLYPNKHYIITKSIAIPEGKTLTIMPGTRLEFNEGCYIKSEGKLIANGKPDSLIVFTSRDPEQKWGGINSHTGNTREAWYGPLYTNSDTSQFTLVKTDVTPIAYASFEKVRYVPENFNSNTRFCVTTYIYNYLKSNMPDLFFTDHNIMTNSIAGMMEDSEFITAPVLHAINAYNDSISCYPTEPTSDCTKRCYFSLEVSNRYIDDGSNYYLFYIDDNPCDTIAYCKFENSQFSGVINSALFTTDCVFTSLYGLNIILYNGYMFGNGSAIRASGVQGYRNCFVNALSAYYTDYFSQYKIKNCNFVNFLNHGYGNLNSISWPYHTLNANNLINSGPSIQKNYLSPFLLEYMVGRDDGITTDHADYPSWLGTGKEEIIRPYVYDSQNPNVDCFTTVDLSNMPKRPIYDTHGIVWKVVVDGYDAQDDFAEMPPLGVGRHKFEVYYNRDDMDTTFTPTVTMGLRQPYTQTPINEGGYWTVKDSASVYTVFLNITGKTNCDGLNRIKVTGGKDYS